MPKTDIIASLQKLHFSKNEALVYFALSELGETRAGAIIKKTALHRSIVYETLDKLVSQQLVFSVIKKNISYYRPTDPTKFLRNIDEEKEIAEAMVADLNMMNPGNLSEISIYEGIESYRHFWLDYMKNCQPKEKINIIGSTADKWQTIMGDPSTSQFSLLQKKKKNRWNIIVFNKNDTRDKFSQEFTGDIVFRLLPSSFDNVGNIYLLGNHSLLIHSTREPMLVQIRNSAMISTYQNLFDILWNLSKELDQQPGYFK